MTVIPLSARPERRPCAGPRPRRRARSSGRARSTTSAFEKHFESAWEKAEQNSKPTDAEIGGHIAAEPKGLGCKAKAPTSSVPKHRRPSGRNSTQVARRATSCNERYGKHGDIATTICNVRRLGRAS